MPTWEQAFSSWGEEQAVVAPPTAPEEVLRCGPEGRLLLVLQEDLDLDLDPDRACGTHRWLKVVVKASSPLAGGDTGWTGSAGST